jgi:hypothetical protein
MVLRALKILGFHMSKKEMMEETLPSVLTSIYALQ